MWLRARVLLKIQEKNLDFGLKKLFLVFFGTLIRIQLEYIHPVSVLNLKLTLGKIYMGLTYILNYFIVLWLEWIVANITEMNPRDEWNFPSAADS